MMMRTLTTVTAAQASTNFSTIFASLSPDIVSTTITGLEFAAKGSNVRNPAVYSGSQPSGSGTNLDNDGRARTWSFTGRDAAGHKSRFFVFGVDSFSEGDYRIDSTESSNVAAIVTFINSLAGSFLSINELKPVWHAYANIGYNDHWIKEYRKG